MGGKFDVIEGGPRTISLVLVRLRTIPVTILISPTKQLMKEELHTGRGGVQLVWYHRHIYVLSSLVLRR